MAPRKVLQPLKVLCQASDVDADVCLAISKPCLSRGRVFILGEFCLCVKQYSQYFLSSTEGHRASFPSNHGSREFV